MVHLRSATKCVVVFLLLSTLTNIIECGRSGGGGRSSGGGSRGSSGSRGWGGWGGSRSSSSSGSSGSRSSSSNHGSSSGYGSSSAINLSPSRTSYSSSSSSQGVISGRVTKPNTNAHSTSHVLPISTGSRTETVHQSHTSSQHATPSHSPSAPPMSGQHNTGGNHAPSAPPLPTSNNKPAPAPGWNVGNDGNIRRDQTQGLNNAYNPNQPGAGMHPPPYSSVPNQPGAGMHPPPYSSLPNQPGAGMHPPPYSSVSNQPGAGMYPPPYTSNPNQPGAGSGMHPPPYSAYPNHYPNAPPPPYPGGVNNYPGPPLSGAPPPYYPSGTQYYSGGSHNYYPRTGGHYSSSAYQNQQNYPQPNSLPPPPPGYSPYGVPYYQKPKSGIKASHVMMGLALWQMTRPHHHHHFYGSGYDSYNNPGGYHEFNRQRYTTTYGSQSPSSNAPGAHNTLEMTHYVLPDKEGAYKTVVGNMTCLSLYDAKAVSIWANRTMDDFYRKFPGSEFPLFDTGKNATNKFENFTMQSGRVIHEETVSVTCCGTDKGPLEINMLTNGKSPDVNCLHFIGKIPFRKLTFIKVNHVPVVNVSMEDWKPIELVEPNFNSTSTPTPLAPFPTNDVNTTDSTSSTTPSVDLTQTFAPLGFKNNVSSITTLEDLKIENSTFPSLESISSTTPDENTFPSLGSKNNTISSAPP